MPYTITSLRLVRYYSQIGSGQPAWIDSPDGIGDALDTSSPWSVPLPTAECAATSSNKFTANLLRCALMVRLPAEGVGAAGAAPCEEAFSGTETPKWCRAMANTSLERAHKHLSI